VTEIQQELLLCEMSLVGGTDGPWAAMDGHGHPQNTAGGQTVNSGRFGTISSQRTSLSLQQHTQ
jgi:hypothetical protein